MCKRPRKRYCYARFALLSRLSTRRHWLASLPKWRHRFRAILSGRRHRPLSFIVCRRVLSPSLLISDVERGLRVHCFGSCDSRDVLDELRRRGLLDDGGAPTQRRPVARKARPEPISASVLEKRNPAEYAMRQALRARQALVRVDARRPAVAAALASRRTASLLLARALANGARRRYPEALRRLPAGHAVRDGGDDAFTKIKREGLLRHACRPPSPAGRVNQTSADSGIPFDSLRQETALGRGSGRHQRPLCTHTSP